MFPREGHVGQHVRRGHVSIGIIEAVSEDWVPSILATLAEAYPNLTYDLRVLANDQIVSELLSTEIDIGVLFDPERFSQLNIGGNVQIAMGVAVPVDHFLAGRKAVRPADLASFRQILPSNPLRIADAALDVLERSGRRPADCLHSNDIRMTRGMIVAGLGIAVLSEIDIATALQDGRVAFVPLTGKEPKPLSLGIATMPHRQLSRSARFVLEALVDRLTKRNSLGTGMFVGRKTDDIES